MINENKNIYCIEERKPKNTEQWDLLLEKDVFFKKKKRMKKNTRKNTGLKKKKNASKRKKGTKMKGGKLQIGERPVLFVRWKKV